MEEENFTVTPSALRCLAEASSLDLLPEKSKKKYMTAYEKFKEWRLKEEAPISENVLLAYFDMLKNKFKPSSLWSTHSMLKLTIKINDNVDITKFSKLFALLKRYSDGYVPTKSKILNNDDIQNFLNTAPDNIYLATKVCSYVPIYIFRFTH
jgi:hypothetical protein